MLKYIDATGRIYVTDDSVIGSPTIFDTDDGLLNVDPADYFSGSVTLPSLSASSSGASGSRNFIDRTAEYFVGTPSTPNANIALGQFRKSGASFYKSALGTHILDMDAVGQTMVPQTDLVGQRYLTTKRTVTPMINNLGHLVFRERTVMRARDPGSPPSITLTLPAVTLEYNLFCGAWWGNAFIVPHGDAAFRGPSAAGPGAPPLLGDQDFGYEYAGRRVYYWVAQAGGGAVTGGTIGGLAITIHDSITAGTTRLTLVSAAPTGTTGSISLTFASAPTVFHLSHFSARSPSNASAPVSILKTGVTSSSSASLTPTITAAQCAVFASIKAGGASPGCTWTNATEQHDDPFQTSRGASAGIIDVGTGAAVTVTATWTSTAGDISLMCAIIG